MSATAICVMVCAMGGVAAHADIAAQSKTSPILSAAFRPAPSLAKSGTGDHGTHMGVQVCGPPYVTGDPDLGPIFLPRTGYLGALLRGYVPLGGLTPQHFLSRYWNYATNDYRFPPGAGFALSGNYPNGRPLVKTTILQIGMKLDRFGGYGGAFLSPMGDLFIRRALPPRNLNTNAQDPEHPCNYHAFKVLKTFRVDVGPAAPAFQQPGGGTQYHVLSKYIPEAPQQDEEVPVSWLLRNGYVEEISPPSQPPEPPEPVTRPADTGRAEPVEDSDDTDDRELSPSSGGAGGRPGTGLRSPSARCKDLAEGRRHAFPSHIRTGKRPAGAHNRCRWRVDRRADHPRSHR